MRYCNFEYEMHTDFGAPYIRGNLLSITNEPKYEVVKDAIAAYDKVFDENAYKAQDNIDYWIGYSIEIDKFIIP